MREAPAKKAAVAHCARKCLQRRFAELDNDSANSAKSFGIEYNSRSQKHIVHNFQCCNIYCNVQTCCNEKYICCNTGMLSNIYCNTWKSVQCLFKCTEGWAIFIPMHAHTAMNIYRKLLQYTCLRNIFSKVRIKYMHVRGRCFGNNLFFQSLFFN